jgi:ubiquinone/menaquinone biosynthesis C-methylase UbiE
MIAWLQASGDRVSNKLEFTGERFMPECVREIRYEHYHRYVFARELLHGRKVLDAACGEGYGSALLAASASSVTGVDLDRAAIEHASSRYRSGNLQFETADCLDLPFEEAAFDAIVSFETLEHLEDQRRLLAGFRRVLRPGGFLLISTPDKAVYTDRLGNRNAFHVRELYRAEFESLLGEFFPAYRLWGQKLMFHSAIWSLDPRRGYRFQQEKDDEVSDFAATPHAPVYLIALCAADEAALPSPDEGLSLFDDAPESVYAHYYHEIRKNMAAGELLADLEREIAELRAGAEAGAGRPWWRRLLGRP